MGCVDGETAMVNGFCEEACEAIREAIGNGDVGRRAQDAVRRVRNRRVAQIHEESRSCYENRPTRVGGRYDQS